MVYKKVRGWTLGQSLPVLDFVKYPLRVLIEYGLGASRLRVCLL